MRLRKSKIAAAALCLAVCVSCTGCKSEEVKTTENLIKDIGTVTLESESGIEAAEEAYNALGDEQKDVSNAQTLTDARAEYDTLYQKAVAPIEQAIEAIPQTSKIATNERAGALIEKARSLYDQADDAAKAAVSNYDVLEQAEKTLGDLKVEAAVAAIDQIGEVSIQSGDALEAAKAAYQSVPKDRRADVTNYGTLTEAQSAYTKIQQEAAEQAKQQALARLTKKTDSVENINWYYPSSYPTYINTRCFMLPYLGEKDGHVWMRLILDYAGNDWIFMDQAIINIDGEVADTISFDYMDVERETAYGAKLYEAVDISPTSSQINLLRKVAESGKTTVRLKGQHQKDFEISSADKQGIKDILAVYDALS